MPNCSCLHHNKAHSVDPTHTKTLRRAFEGDVGKRFRWLRGRVRKAILDLDVFGMKQNASISAPRLPPEGAFAYPRSADKITAFMQWLKDQENAGILGIRRGLTHSASEVEWANVYIDHAYRQGIRRAHQELKDVRWPGVTVDDKIIDFAFAQPFHADRVGLIYTRVYSELKGITEAMDVEISRILADGMARGESPRNIAAKLSKSIKGMETKRARVMARTEIIRAHHHANINTYKEAGVQGVKLQAEWSTAGDLHVCPVCLAMEADNPYTLEAILPLIPVHPNCRCVALPLVQFDMEMQGMDLEGIDFEE